MYTCGNKIFFENVQYIAFTQKGNFVFSGLSAHMVLSMAAFGAGGTTATAMRNTLQLPNVDNITLVEFEDFVKRIDNSKNIVLKLAIKIFFDNRVVIEDQYKEISEICFRSKSETIDFQQNSACNIINYWSAASTNGKINSIVEPENITKNSMMFLINALYFKGELPSKFLPTNTTMKPFHLVNEPIPVNVPTMLIQGEFPYLVMPEVNAECIALPFKNNKFYIIIIVPYRSHGLEVIEENIEIIDLKFLKCNKHKISLSLPKFKIMSHHDFKQILSLMGMSEMFTPSANFSKISKIPLKVDEVIQEALIEIYEDEAEAACEPAAGESSNASAEQSPPKILKVDKPFMYKIMYNSYTLFSGRMANPLLS